MRPIIVFFALALFPIFSFASDSVKANPNILFNSSEPLELIIQMDIEKAINDKTDDPEYNPALLLLEHEDNSQVFNVKIKARGNTRRIEDICEFPPLKINFEKKSTEKTVFQGQDKIKVVTHCKESEVYQNYALLEYLAYKTYNTLTDYSYRVRMVNVIYRDIKQNYPDIEKSGFLIEDDDLLAKRIGGQVSNKKIWSPDSCESEVVDMFALFQFMIGNTDWWIHTRHNVDLVNVGNDQLIPIPFDFDGAGIINAPYASPSQQLPIISVRDRFFKGPCKTTEYYSESIELFNNKKEMIMAILENANFLDKKYKKKSLKYVEEFYQIINNQDQFYDYLSQTCDFVKTHNPTAYRNME